MTEAVSSSQRSSRHFRGVTSFIARNYLNLFSAGLLIAALFYFVQIQQLRHATLSNNPELFTDFEIVTITRVIDGDEIRIRNSKGSTRVRILGIKSFDSTERDLMLADYGKIAADFLGDEAVGKEAQIKLSEKRVDDDGRLLATIFIGDDRNQDLAKMMVGNGMTLVYTKYPFPAMDEYLKVQDTAKGEAVGLWQNQRVRARAESMLDLWNQERRDR